jgi:putative ABC transport system permease protein
MTENCIFITTEKGTDSAPLKASLSEMEELNGIDFTDSVLNNFKNMVENLDAIVLVLIISSMALAFVVLGNLTNVNIAERQREIATIKVLGFRKKEVENYIYKENNILVVFGSFAGIPLGMMLHRFIMGQVEMSYVMFGRSVNLLSVVKAVLLTVGFGLLVNLFMRRRLMNIQMVESLKSVE